MLPTVGRSRGMSRQFFGRRITLRTDHCLNMLGRISGYRASLAGNGGHLAEASFHAIVEELVAKELDGDRVGTALLAGAIVGAVRAWIARPEGMEVAEVVGRTRVLANDMQAYADGA